MKCSICENSYENRIYEGNKIEVFYNIRGANKGQCIIVPKRHVTNIKELKEDELTELILTVQKVSRKFTKYINSIGFNYGFNEGEYAGQMTEHFHFHIIPRLKGDKVEKLPEYHLFHRDPKTKKNKMKDELDTFVEEFKNVLK